MALSVYDQSFLPKEQQQKITMLTKELENNPEKMPEIHQAVEDIRATAGYSGGADGSSYVKLNNPTQNMPELPDFAGFRNNAPEMPNIENDFKWDGGSYKDEINNMLSEVKSQVDKGFQYDANNDQAFLSFKNQMMRMGNDAYQSNLASASARTGGTMSSYSQAVASQARNQYLQTATDAIPTFRNQALNEYKAELDSKLSLVDAYNTMNEQEYSKYQDEINLAVNQYEMELDNYLTDIELAEKAYEYEIGQYEQVLKEKQEEIAEAWDRTQTLGYVSNRDASILGLEAGTLSEDARKAYDELQNYIQKQEIDLDFYQRELNTKINAERRQALWEKKNLPSGGSGDSSDPEKVFDLSYNERKEIDSYEQDYWDEMGEITDVGLATIPNPDDPRETIKVNKWEQMSKQEKAKLINDEIRPRVSGLFRELQFAKEAGDNKRIVIVMSKLKTIYDSKWFISYADDNMKSAKQVFISQYDRLLGNATASEPEEETVEVGSNGVPKDLINPTNTRQGTK